MTKDISDGINDGLKGRLMLVSPQKIPVGMLGMTK